MRTSLMITQNIIPSSPLLQTAKKASEKSTVSVREMVGGELHYTITVDGCDIVCVQKYKRI